ncbi:MAG: polysaccharide deacetylase family protein [Ruminiclostridium sp.]|nr:polysaccharide deacetylase family protein [Ruminiclostridium sp.]
MKLFLFRKRYLAIPGAILAVVTLCLVTTLPSYVTTAATQRQLPIYRVQRDHKVVSLSFDAAWGNEDTETLIQIFDQYDVKVTFFVVGEWVDKYPESVKALHDAGHEVMGHSNDHAHFNALSADEIIADITACNEKIEKITGVSPTLFRPPYGEYDDHVVSTVRGMGLEIIQWDVDSLDWKDYDAATITDRVTSRVGSGSIVLFHNAALHTPEALPGILEYLLQEGYDIVPISQLILPGEYGTDYTIDHTGRQCPAE